jgi:hyperosmotically inducible protein
MNLLKRTAALLVVPLVLGAAGCTKSSTDDAISSRVKTAISNEPGLTGTNVSVSTDKKVVHLNGTVKSRAERAMLIAVARKVEGVKAVKTDLLVTPPQKPGVKPQQKPRVEARGGREPRAQQRVTQRGEVIPGTGR